MFLPNPDPGISWLWERTCLLVRSGSHAYGTNIEGSDYDAKGVAVAPMERYRLGFRQHFEQASFKTPIDMTVYDIAKFFNLAADCNPNIIEVLWVNKDDILVENQVGRLLRENRNLFLSKKARYTFSGYAFAQLKRIKTHRRWLLDPPQRPPTRAECGLPERTVIPADMIAAANSLVDKKLASWNPDSERLSQAERLQLQASIAEMLAELGPNPDPYTSRLQAAKLLGFEDNFIEYIEHEKSYQSRKHEWDQFQDWKTNRNEARANLEAKYLYDCKHANHLVRLLKMCKEILTLGEVIVKRPDAEELKSIRNGAWSYEKLIGWAEEADSEMEELYRKSELPRAPDLPALDDLCAELISLEEGRHKGIRILSYSPSK